MKWIEFQGIEPDNEVLAINNRGEYLIGYVGKGKNDIVQCDNDHEILENVTHWMPLPDKPKPLKPLSELTEEDAIKIAEASIETSFDAHCKTTYSYTLISSIGSVYFQVWFDDFFFCQAYKYDGSLESVNMKHKQAKSTDKARELGYQI